MSTNLKTTTRSSYECNIYRTLGGSIAKYGMGDSDRAERNYRSMLENKLSNRSLILVGGGISHSSMNNTTLNNSGGYNPNNNMAAASVTTTTTIQQTASTSLIHGKRQRKRVGGNGIFGSISNKRRKKILKQKQQASFQKIIEEDRSNEVQKQTICVPGNIKMDATTTTGEDANQQQRNAQQQQQQHTQHQHQQLQQQQMSSVIETIHKKWSNYITQLLTMTMKNNNTNKDITTTTPSSTAINERISYLLATSEHVGMAVTIVKCNSRRHLLNSRCIVINETTETWKMAMLVVAAKKMKKKRKNYKEEAIKCNVDNSNKEKEHNNQGIIMSTTPSSWSIVMVPKRGTTLEVNVPWNESSLLIINKSATITSKETMNHIIVRLEN